jgi:hypothetical protein
LILEDKDLKFASRSLEGGVGASAGFGTVGGGAAVVASRKRDVSEMASSQIDLLTRRLSENSDRHTSTTEKAMVHLFSPSPTFTDVSTVGTESAYVAAKECKVTVERKLLCVKEQIEYHKYVLMSEYFDSEEKGNSKKELNNLMLELKELTK